MYHLTNQKLYELRIEVETQRGQDAFAGYSVFTVGPEHEGYRISTLGMYYGNAGKLFDRINLFFLEIILGSSSWEYNEACYLHHSRCG